MAEQICMRCGKRLPSADAAYTVQVRIFAGFDGVLSEPAEGVDAQLRRLLEQVEETDPGELERDVYEEFTLILCKSCRDRFVEETKHPWEGRWPPANDPNRFIH